MSDFLQNLLTQTSLNNAFNADQAQINRDWQEYMSGSSHQREVNDLVAAGLNPVLSANSGSSWQSVGNAAADPGASNLAATMLNNQASIEMSKIGAAAQVAAASSAASIAASATRYAADAAAQASRDTAPTTIHGSFGPADFTFSAPSGEIDEFANSFMQGAGQGFAASGQNGGYNY